LKLEKLFSPGKIGNVTIKNRIVRSSTFTRRATKDGLVSKQLIKFYNTLAQGGTGLIITGNTAIERGYAVAPYSLCLYDDSFVSGQKKLVDAVHEYSDVKISAQLSHTGRQGSNPKYQPVAPSPIRDKMTKRMPRELTAGDIEKLIKKFVEAGRRAYESGYDMVQYMAAHGYCLSNFLSPYSNQRSDEFGGNIQKRTKILVDIYNGLREEIGKNFPIIVKLQTIDGVSGGLTLEEGVEIAKIVVETGYDAIEPSGGLGETLIGSKNQIPSKVIKSPEDENFFLQNAKELKKITRDCPIILMGGIKNPLSAEKFLQENVADFISMSRPLIYEPDLPNRWKSGDLSPASCKSCNSCYMTMMTGPMHCVVKAKIEKKRLRKEKLKK